MEIKRKTMQDGAILEKEKELCEKITEICDENKARFASLGYELELVFESQEEEYGEFAKLSLDDGKEYKTNYVSRAAVTVKRPKTEEETAEQEPAEEAEQEPAEETPAREASKNETSAEDEQAEADKTLAQSEDELRRSVAFTNVMMIRTYKTFWVEKLIIGDDCEQTLRADLDEFFDHLSEDGE